MKSTLLVTELVLISSAVLHPPMTTFSTGNYNVYIVFAGQENHTHVNYNETTVDYNSVSATL